LASNWSEGQKEPVRHREPYRAVSDLNDVRDSAVLQSVAEFLEESLGAERREEWLKAAEEGNLE
jgi:hypothetical protein